MKGCTIQRPSLHVVGLTQEGVLLRTFDDRSRVSGWCVACLRARFARTLPSRLHYGVA